MANVTVDTHPRLPYPELIYDPDTSRRVLQPFAFEVYNPVDIQIWMYEKQPQVNWLALAYLIFVFVGPKVMQHRKPFDLRGPLVLWNWALAIFSLAGFLRMVPTFIALLGQPNGIDRSVCTRDYAWEPDLFWGFLFTVSKAFELIDTVFIVLRKAPLIFLHWFHHVSMLLFMFHLGPIGDPCGRWNVIINFGVHSVMYSYYALRGMRIQIPKQISKAITTIQMVQFITCFFSSIRAIYIKLSGGDCILHPMTMGVEMFGSLAYLTLFANFFIQTYIKNKSKKPKTQ